MAHLTLDHGTVNIADDTPRSRAGSKYCYLLPKLARAEAARGATKDALTFRLLNELAAAIDHAASAFESARPSALPAIYTYFGQFLNHDISAPAGTPDFRQLTKLSIDKMHNRGDVEPHVIESNPDLIALMSAQRAPSSDMVVDALVNLHPAPMQLHSLYGAGPGNDGEGADAIYAADGITFALAKVAKDDKMTADERQRFAGRRALPFDHRRNTKEGVTFIADRRNDENLILSQLHLAFMLFHNTAVDQLRQQNPPPVDLFKAAQELVRWHYQWCILHDYLPKLVPNLPASPRGLLTTPGQVPLEFTSAAFRFGHSMVSKRYNYNEVFSFGGRQGPATLSQLFNFTSPGGMGTDTQSAAPEPIPEQLPESWIIDWGNFIDAGPQATTADKIDPVISPEMSALPGSIPEIAMHAGLKAIAYRNLRRGFHRFIASGQELAGALGIPLLTHDEMKSFFTADGDYRPGISELSPDLLEDGSELFTRTPAWFYFLCEARLRADGQALGPTAAAIVGETIQGLLHADLASVVHAEEWRMDAGEEPTADTLWSSCRFNQQVSGVCRRSPPLAQFHAGITAASQLLRHVGSTITPRTGAGRCEDLPKFAVT